MATETLPSKSEIQWFEVDIPIRGCGTSLQTIRELYVELDTLNQREADRILGALPKLENTTADEFAENKAKLRSSAFCLTVSIVGGVDNVTKYGENATIFQSNDLPQPINTIFFTNENSYKRNANGASPPNFFRLWLNFDKPPLFDPNPLVSAPTQNASAVKLKAEDLTYFRAAQSIIKSKLSRNLWYGAIHEKFAYDVGLWFFFLPYWLYTITIYSDKWLPTSGPYATFRVAFFIYGIGTGLFTYRFLYSYFKWAYPVNILTDNKDTATKHRVFFGVVIVAILVNFISHFFGF